MMVAMVTLESEKNKMADQVTWHFLNGYIFLHIQRRDFWFEAQETVACLDYDGCYGNFGIWKNKMADQVTWHFLNGYIFLHIQRRDF